MARTHRCRDFNRLSAGVWQCEECGRAYLVAEATGKLQKRSVRTARRELLRELQTLSPCLAALERGKTGIMFTVPRKEA